MKKIVCFSGGKDSTAMLIHLIQNNKQIDDIIYVDMGEWMWESAKEHIHKVEETLNVKINILSVGDEISKGFQRWGFPSMINRWCTGIKKDTMKKYLKKKYPNEEIIQYIGYCSDEVKRTGKKLYSFADVEYPLVEAGITEEDALSLCYEYGFDFNGVYEHHSHFNCWMCPLQKVSELEYIYIYRKDLWNKLRELQTQTDGSYRPNYSLFYYDEKFWKKQHKQLEEKRMKAREKYNKR